MKYLPLFILLAHPAAASLVSPDAVAEQTMAKNDVTCVLCHTSRAGGAGTVSQPFAKSLKVDRTYRRFEPKRIE
jgi:mono/diheme cytochrome c family protein